MKWALSLFKGDENVGIVTVKLEGRVGYLNNTESFFNKFIEIFENIKEGQKFIIDLTKVDFIYPNALFFLLSIRETLRNQKCNLDILIDEGSEVHEYLDYSGFCKAFEISSYPQNKKKTLVKKSDVLELEFGDKITNYTKKASDLVDFLKTRQSMSLLVESEIISSIEEILRNIDQHSEYKKYYLLGQSYPASKRIRFVFYDNGIGIKQHMTRNIYDDMHKTFKRFVTQESFEKMKTGPANLAIREAAKYAVSATNYKDNSGAGINYIIKELSSITHGVVSILSEDGIIIWKDGSESPVYNQKLPYPIKGTIVSLTLDCEPGTKIITRGELND